ncbi:hypothetical protein AXE80_09480 [Wenyingzhuangia fucanilytica]|uniref:Prenyltransferase n=1 Tax=Wenyingzhuangia fucanilytica TaxID=1790137 RepID=A0A1B1Y6X5_9FLAO|nr:geranylgeranylglycerol-phosphate geranylgeranyltransferase [Wenyingzhuangia fucanilytica]ANW96497.1 hypothetical protein AXE80_09480 [Wenyingzhuangia fucanilytica]
MVSILQLIRWKNLVLISIGQIIIIWSLYSLEQFTLPAVFYIICTLCFAAGGNIINDYFDLIPDKINKPQKQIIGKIITPKKAFTLYIFINIIGLIIGTLICFLLQSITLYFYGIPVIILLYLYSKKLKGTPLLGNIIIASFTAFSMLFILMIIPSSPYQKGIIYLLSLFAFLLNFIREIIKDIEDIKGDKKALLKTLPILIGTKSTIKFVRIIILFTLMCFVMLLYITNQIPLKIYIFVTLILPLSNIFINLKNSKKKHDYSRISKNLKLIIAFGIFTILFT